VFETWSFSETIHSRSYTHIIRNVISDPAAVFDDIVSNEYITKRAESVTKYYDDLIEGVTYYQNLGEGKHEINGEIVEINLRELKRKLYLTVASVNVLEAIRFYVSFACSFAFAERAKMEGNAKIIKLIARDEALHLTGTQHMLQIWALGKDDPEMGEITKECREEVINIFREAAEQEKEWAQYLFKDGSMIGLNKDILCQAPKFATCAECRLGEVLHHGQSV
jgi:ribonucleoside-diphosphate reductase beta chain